MTRMQAERISRGLRQVDLAVLAKVNQGTLCRIERGKQHPSPAQRARLAAALALDPKNLLEEIR